MFQAFLVITTVPDATLARQLAHELLTLHLAACVNIQASTTSVYRWQGKVEEAAEVVLQIKTSQARYPEVEQAILRLHPYEVPEIIGLPIVIGAAAYLDWVRQETEVPLAT